MNQSSDIPITASKVCLEMCIEWIVANPELFKMRYQEFLKEYGEAFAISATVRKHSFRMIADRKLMGQMP